MYTLVANVSHMGKPDSGRYKIQVKHAAADTFYEVEGLRVTEVIPQTVAVTECYILLYERNDVQSDGSFQTRKERTARLAGAMERLQAEGAGIGEELAGDHGMENPGLDMADLGIAIG